MSKKNLPASNKPNALTSRILDLAVTNMTLEQMGEELEMSPEKVWTELQKAFKAANPYDDLQRQFLLDWDLMNLKNDLQEMVQLAKNTHQLDAKVTGDLIKLMQLLSDRVEARMERARADLTTVQEAHATLMLRFIRDSVNVALEQAVTDQQVRIEFERVFKEALVRALETYEP